MNSEPTESKTPVQRLVMPLVPRDLPAWKPFLRGYFWVRRHTPSKGWCICWHAWNPHFGWGVDWGIGFSDLRSAKAVRRFLNQKVSRGGNYGLSMQQVVEFVKSGNGPRHEEWGRCYF